MSAITDIRYVLTQKALDALCDKFHIPGEVHLIFPNQNDTMHERPSGKIRLYTRFFDYANFRLPLFTFLVDVLRIIISSGCDFACPVSFSWHTAKHMTRDPDPPAADFNAQDYTTLVAYPSPFQNELEASVERLFDEGGSGTQTKQGDSIKGEVSHHPKKLRKDHGTPSGASVGGKSQSMLHRLLAGAVLNAEVRIMTIVTTTTSTVDPTLATKKKFIEPSLFGAGSCFAGRIDPITGIFSYLTSSHFLVGAIHTVINPDTDLQKVYVPQWSVMNGSRLDDGRICRKMVDEFAPLKFFASVCEMEHDQLFPEFNARAARQMSISAKVRMRAEYNVNEKRRLKSVVENQEKSLRDETNALRERNVILEKERNALDVKVTEHETPLVNKEHELTDLNALVKSVKSQNDNLAERIHELEISYGLQEKVTVYENCMEQHEKFQDDRMKVVNDKFDNLWLLTQGMELAIIKCMNLPEYLSALRVAIGKAIEKGMQDGLSAGITHGNKGKVLTDVAAYNPSTEADWPLVEKLGLDKLQPNIDQLMVPIHHSPDKVVIGATALSLALDVSNILLIGTKGTSDVVSATGGATTTMSTNFASANTIAHIYVNDYKVIDEDDQAAADGNTASFPNVDDVELNIV
nr:hypothetical protein [Tanacetum cinerariifolium]